MKNKYIVELTEAERTILREVVKKLKGTSQQVKRANILLKADAGWADARIAEALDCRTKTVENVRQRFVEEGFDVTLDGKQRETPLKARSLVSRIEFHPTPKHGSWLNMAPVSRHRRNYPQESRANANDADFSAGRSQETGKLPRATRCFQAARYVAT